MPLVDVIIPAYNAGRTIDRTLDSVRSQTHRDLQIVVVDDGSTDDTVEQVEQHCQRDPRIRLISQPNLGVAAARNRGLAEGDGCYVAPVDADDLWHPDKIRRQLGQIEEHGEVALVATAYSVIDAQDRIVAKIGGVLPKAHQFENLCRRNFIGNGSSALMRRTVVERLGGYDTSLKDEGGQGCEDLKLYLQIAEATRLAFIPEPLTAYRRGPSNMSLNGRQMLRSFDLVADSFCRRRPDLRSSFNAHRVYMLCWLINGALRSGNDRESLDLGWELLTTRSLVLPQALGGAAMRRLAKTLKQHFGEHNKPDTIWLNSH